MTKVEVVEKVTPVRPHFFSQVLAPATFRITPGLVFLHHQFSFFQYFFKGKIPGVRFAQGDKIDGCWAVQVGYAAYIDIFSIKK